MDVAYCWPSKKRCDVAIGIITFSISIKITFCAAVKFLNCAQSEAIRASIGAESSLSLFNILHVYYHLVVTYWMSFFGTSLGIIVFYIVNSLSDACVDELKCSISDRSDFIIFYESGMFHLYKLVWHIDVYCDQHYIAGLHLYFVDNNQKYSCCL